AGCRASSSRSAPTDTGVQTPARRSAATSRPTPPTSWSPSSPGWRPRTTARPRRSPTPSPGTASTLTPPNRGWHEDGPRSAVVAAPVERRLVDAVAARVGVVRPVPGGRPRRARTLLGRTAREVGGVVGRSGGSVGVPGDEGGRLAGHVG